MDYSRYVKQMTDFNKSLFENVFNSIALAMEQMEAMIEKSLPKMPWVQEAAITAANEWVSACKKGREDFKKTIDESFSHMQEFFSSAH